MDNATTNITFQVDDKIPLHKISYLLGIMIGMKISYHMDEQSSLYTLMREAKKGRWQEAKRVQENAPFIDGYRVLYSGGNKDDFTFTIKRSDEIAPLREEKNPEAWRGPRHIPEDIMAQRSQNKDKRTPVIVNGHDLIILGRGPSKEGCPVGEIETWATLSILELEDWVDKSYSKLFCVERIPGYMQPWKPIEIAHKRGIPIIGDKRYSWVTEEWEQWDVYKHFNSIFYLNSISHMIALALYRGYKSLWLWGVDQTNEYSGPMYEGWNKPADMYKISRHYVTYWLGVAHGIGARWETCPDSQLWREECI